MDVICFTKTEPNHCILRNSDVKQETEAWHSNQQSETGTGRTYRVVEATLHHLSDILLCARAQATTGEALRGRSNHIHHRITRCCQMPKQAGSQRSTAQIAQNKDGFATAVVTLSDFISADVSQNPHGPFLTPLPQRERE